MTDYQKSCRSDLAVLDALSRCKDGVDINVLHEIVCPREPWLSLEMLGLWLDCLEQQGFVGRTPESSDSALAQFHITCKGHAHLAAGDAKAIFGERVDNHAAPANTRDRCCLYAPADPEPDPALTVPSTALICLDEDELDDWWSSLDVEQKADAFTQFSLMQHEGFDSHVYVESANARIPVTGSIGATSQFRCSYCESAELPLKAQYSADNRLVGATCSKPECEAQFNAAFPVKPVPTPAEATESCLAYQRAHGEQGSYE